MSTLRTGKLVPLLKCRSINRLFQRRFDPLAFQLRLQRFGVNTALDPKLVHRYEFPSKRLETLTRYEVYRAGLQRDRVHFTRIGKCASACEIIFCSGRLI